MDFLGGPPDVEPGLLEGETLKLQVRGNLDTYVVVGLHYI